jgi:L-asparagine transporter-like permease
MIEKKKPNRARRSLENEVIIAIIILYVVIASIMVLVHYLQPKEQVTQTSSTSPSHNEQSTK